jgi:hypothetical protein
MSDDVRPPVQTTANAGGLLMVPFVRYTANPGMHPDVCRWVRLTAHPIALCGAWG